MQSGEPRIMSRHCHNTCHLYVVTGVSCRIQLPMSKSRMSVTSEIRPFACRLYVSPTVACTYFVANALPVATIIVLTGRKSLRQILTTPGFWSFPYYLMGIVIAVLVSIINRYVWWQSSLLVLPPLFLIYRSYQLYLGELQEQKRHVQKDQHHMQEMANLHLR